MLWMRSEFLQVLTIRILLVIKRHFLRIVLFAYVLSWNIVTMVICKQKSTMPKRLHALLRRQTYGLSSTRWSWGWNRSMTSKLSIEISNVPMFSSRKMGWWNWVIWMFPKLLRPEFWKLKQELHITQVLKSGKISHMIWNPIYGLWAVYCMN